MTICAEIGEWAAGLRPADLPASVSVRAELQAKSIAAGRTAGESTATPFAAVAPDGPAGEIYRSAAASIAHDWDDYLFMGHTGHSAVPAAAAFAGDPERALVAQVAANEVAGRLGAALFLGPHNGQFWAYPHSRAVCGRFANEALAEFVEQRRDALGGQLVRLGKRSRRCRAPPSDRHPAAPRRCGWESPR